MMQWMDQREIDNNLKPNVSARVSAQLATLEGVEAMPLWSEQMLALKQGDTKIPFQMEKP